MGKTAKLRNEPQTVLPIRNARPANPTQMTEKNKSGSKRASIKRKPRLPFN
jgi:hypothetical protein